MKNGTVASLLVLVIITGSTSVVNGTNRADSSSPPATSTPVFTFWWLVVTPAACNLSTGECVMTMTNNGDNSSYDLAFAADYCNMDLVFANNSTATYYTEANGTVGGEVLNGLPFGADLTATCTVPTAQLTSEPNGWPASGRFIMKLLNSVENISSGQTAPAGFFGVWFEPPALTTITSTVTTTSFNIFTLYGSTTKTVTSTVTSVGTTTLTNQNAGSPTFPYQLLVVGLLAALLVTSYFAVKGLKANREPL